MKKLKIIIITWIIIMPAILHAQVILKTDSILNTYNRIHEEYIYIHQNASLLIVGEQLYYKIYCIDPETNELSSLSKFGYVELLGVDNNQIFKHKFKLKSGLGQGDFFIPTTIPSGNYKILGYTEWMKNFGLEKFFQSDLYIINPYQSNEKSIIQKYDSTQITPKKNIESTIQIASLPKSYTDKNLKLIINKNEFSQRSKATIRIQEILDPGNYSISVRKKEFTSKFINPTSKTYRSIYKNKGKSKNEKIYLPEVRGELIYGKLVSSDSNFSISGKKVALSIPGKEFVFQISTTNEDGLFYFNLNKVYNDTKALIQVLDEDKKDYQILMNQQSPIDQSSLAFNELKISEQAIDLIVQRSIHNQVENAYLKLKQDSIKTNNYERPFYYKNQTQSYNLDDYTRFPTVKETILEIVNEVWTKKNKKDEYIFQVRGINHHPDARLAPLVLLDGNLIQDHNKLINNSSDKIKRISIFKELFSIGTKIYDGFISFETFDGYIENNIGNDKVLYLDLLQPQPKKVYFNQSYDADSKISMSHIPDYRYQLLWIPNLNFKGDEMIIEFFTSDITGNFEISIEGFMNSGMPVSLKEFITVK